MDQLTLDKHYSFESHNYPGLFLRHRQRLGELTDLARLLDCKDGTFKAARGLADVGCVSLESVNYPGYFLKGQREGSGVRLCLAQIKPTDPQTAKAEATFRVRDGIADQKAMSFESYTQPGFYVRHRYYHLYVEKDSTDLFKADATFWPRAPRFLPVMEWDWTRDEQSNFQVWWATDRGPGNAALRAPWRQLNEAVPTQAEGWVLLAKRFGTQREPVPLPYFMLYNRYLGRIRVHFFFPSIRGPEEGTRQLMGHLEISRPIPAFTFFTGTALDTFDAKYAQISMTEGLFADSWNSLEFDVAGYDPDIRDGSKADAEFTIRLYSVQPDDLEAQGYLSLSGFLQAADLQAGESGGALETAKAVGGAAVSGFGTFKDVRAGIEEAGTWGVKNIDRGALSNAIGGLAAGLWSTAPPVAGAASFILGLVSGFGSSQTFPLRWNVELGGKMILTGKLISRHPIGQPLRLLAPGTIHRSESYEEYLPLYDQPLGVFSLKYQPIAATLMGYRPHPKGKNYPPFPVKYFVSPLVALRGILVNNRCGLKLVSAAKSVILPDKSPAFVKAGRWEVPFQAEQQLDQDTKAWEWKPEGALGIELRFQAEAGAAPQPIVFYRKFPMRDLGLGDPLRIFDPETLLVAAGVPGQTCEVQAEGCVLRITGGALGRICTIGGPGKLNPVGLGTYAKPDAEIIVRIFRHYGINMVAGPGPEGVRHFIDGVVPQGAFPGEDAIAFDATTLKIKSHRFVPAAQPSRSVWSVVVTSEAGEVVLSYEHVPDMGSPDHEDEARRFVERMKAFGVTRKCFVGGRVKPSLVYYRR